ncbi:hypothetical protein BRAT_10975 [Leptospira interrogans serovar Bratislava]|nr:hypothetical protein BRAT_10975 [Leptospira interrogans serovar Bratislava]OOB97240.1 hypothetical protein B0192_17940 [Leptospira interrogans serovar Australis]
MILHRSHYHLVNAVNLRLKIKEFSTTKRHGQERITVIGELEVWIYSRKILEMARLKPSAFTRNRELTLPRFLIAMINLLNKSLAVELYRYFKNLGKKAVTK